MTLTTAPPRLAPGLEFLGEMPGSSFVDSQWLIRSGSRNLQVSELLYRTAEQIDGRRDVDDIAALVTERTPWLVTGAQVAHVIATKLVPLGLVPSPDGATAAKRQAPSPLQLAGKVRMLGPRVIDPIARVLQVLFLPPVLVLYVLAIAGTHAWLYLSHGLTDAIVEFLVHPVLVLPLFAVIVVAGFFHEFGHAAALRYGGGRVRGMGFGFYLVYPALYTDTSDAYRLGRWAKVRVDLGGFYFHLVFAVAIMAAAFLTGHEFLLIAVLAINLEVIRQLVFPFVRFDGYWLLADLIGVPDLYSHAGPLLARLRPGARASTPAGPRLKPWAHRIFVGYVGFAVVALAGLLFVFVTRAPRFLGTAWDSMRAQAQAASAALDGGIDVLALLAAVLQMLILALPVVGGAFVIYSLVRLVAGVTAATRRHLRAASARDAAPGGSSPITAAAGPPEGRNGSHVDGSRASVGATVEGVFSATHDGSDDRAATSAAAAVRSRRAEPDQPLRS